MTTTGWIIIGIIAAIVISTMLAFSGSSKESTSSFIGMSSIDTLNGCRAVVWITVFAVGTILLCSFTCFILYGGGGFFIDTFF